MKCLRCQNEMKHLSNNQIEVDVCLSGCGGIWFDGRELKRMDEVHEVDQSFLETLSQGQHQKKSDQGQRLNCPKCSGITLMRRFHSPSRSVEIDECAGCGGLWFDAGEYTQIIKEYPTEESRKKAAEAFVSDVFGKNFDKLISDQKEKQDKIQKITQMLKFLTPSSYSK